MISLVPETAFLPKLSPPALSYVIGWAPDHDARMWMKGQTPQWLPYAPLDGLAKSFDITPTQRLAMAQRIVADSVGRFGYCAEPTKYMEQPFASPDWAFEWPGESGPQYRLAWQETTLAHVYWAWKQGVVDAFHVAAAQFLAYYNSKKVPYLREGWKAKQPYADAGRHRTLRGCIDLCVHMLMMLRDCGITSGVEVEFLRSVLSGHLSALANFPLVDDGKGDHLGLGQPFVSVYQTASLRHVLERARNVAWDGASWTGINTAIAKIEDLLIGYGLVNRFKPNAPLHEWLYDIPFVDGKPVAPDFDNPKTIVNNGVLGVAAYLVPLLASTLHADAKPCFEAMKAHAIGNSFPSKYPAETAQWFGGLV